MRRGQMISRSATWRFAIEDPFEGTARVIRPRMRAHPYAHPRALSIATLRPVCQADQLDLGRFLNASTQAVLKDELARASSQMLLARASSKRGLPSQAVQRLCQARD